MTNSVGGSVVVVADGMVVAVGADVVGVVVGAIVAAAAGSAV
jgi:hypothetical protein